MVSETLSPLAAELDSAEENPRSTVHSLIHALVRYSGIKFILISPEELRLPGYMRSDVLDKGNIPYKEVVRLEDALPKLDLLYMTLRYVLHSVYFLT